MSQSTHSQRRYRDDVEDAAAADDDAHSTSNSVAATPSHSPAALRRLQVIHPISLLLLIASYAVTTTVTHPNLRSVSRLHPTFFNPNEIWLGGFWALLLFLQVGTTLCFALASGDRSKALLTNAVSITLPFSNLLLAIWAPLFILDKRTPFIAGEALLGLALLLLLFSLFVTALRKPYQPTWRRPIEWLFIHAPIRLFLVVLLHVDIWQQGLICFGYAPPGPPDVKHTLWPSFIIIVSVGLGFALWIFATTDVVLGLGGIYMQLAILWQTKPSWEQRPTELIAAHILSIVLMGVALISSIFWGRLIAVGAAPDASGHRRSQPGQGSGRIQLPMSPEEEQAIIRAEVEAELAARRADEARHNAGLPPSASRSPTGTNAEPTPSQLERGEAGHSTAADNASTTSSKKTSSGGGDVGVTRKLGGGH